MNETKTQLIKNAAAKIDADKINNYLKANPKSKTLKQIINYRKRVLYENKSDGEVFKWGVEIAYNLDVICDPNKGNYVKNEPEKKYWLGISRELFENTIGVKEKSQ